MVTPMLDPKTNFAKADLLSGILAGGTSLAIASGDASLFPNPTTKGAFNTVLFNSTDYPNPTDDPAHEIIRMTAESGGIYTITRAQEGTSDVNHNTGGKTYSIALVPTKKTMTDIAAHLGIAQFMDVFSSSAKREVQFATSNDDGTIVVVVARRASDGDLSIHRWSRDPVTGALGNARNVASTAVMDAAGEGGLAILGNYAFLFTFDASNNLVCKRYDLADLSIETAITITGSPTGNGSGVFCDGTFLYVRLSAASGTFTKYSLSGTTLTSAGTITGGITDVKNALYADGVVYMQKSLFGVDSFEIVGTTFDALTTGGIGWNSFTACGLAVHTDNSLLAFGQWQFGANDGGGVVWFNQLYAMAFERPI